MFILDTLVIDKALTMPMFVVIIVFVLLIGSLISLGVLRLFQQRARYGIVCFGGAVVSLTAFIFIASSWTL